jgi:hypothetical protein
MDEEWREYCEGLIGNSDNKEELLKYITKILDARPALAGAKRDDFTDGVTAGLEWAVRILVKDKSAY